MVPTSCIWYFATLHKKLSPGLPYSMMVVYKTTHRLAKICNLFLALTLLAFNSVGNTSRNYDEVDSTLLGTFLITKICRYLFEAEVELV